MTIGGVCRVLKILNVDIVLTSIWKGKMIENFNKAISFVLTWEGGYSDNPQDTGGETHWGISKRSYPDCDIKNLTKEQAIEIYRKDYWNVMNCDSLPYPLDVVCMDTAVNMGVGRAQTLLDWTQDWRDYLMFRISKYNDLAKKHSSFLRGWINRTISLWKVCKG